QFVVELWESIFTPGVTPTLLKATYGAFIMLITTLSVLLFFTRNIHVLALLVLSFGLVLSLAWFLQELEIAKAQ
ncbi:ER protein Pkr1-domain-containing protein, partial [Protomyces lactucae-debilis]